MLNQISKAMKSDSRYLEMLQRVPLAEKGCTERYSERSEFWKQNRIKPWSCIPTTRIWRVETMMGAPITAQEYRCFIRTFSTMRMTQETSVLVKACVVRHRRTKVVPRVIYYPVLGNRDGIFCAQNIPCPKTKMKGCINYERKCIGRSKTYKTGLC